MDLYGKTWTEDKKRREVEWIEKNRQANAQSPMEQGDFGILGAENEYNEEHKIPEVPNL